VLEIDCAVGSTHRLRPARVRILGETGMVGLNSTAFVVVTGNGLTVTEDLARRFIPCELDARCEDPESRPFVGGFVESIECRRADLLAAALTIWRWGCQNVTALTPGNQLGSFEPWAKWCRDPMVSLGCRDPVERIEALKANDPHRRRIAEICRAWWEHHGASAIKVNDLDDAVKAIADPQRRGRQYLATFISTLAGTYAAGFVLNRQEPAGKWTAATYALAETSPADRAGYWTGGWPGRYALRTRFKYARQKIRLWPVKLPTKGGLDRAAKYAVNDGSRKAIFLDMLRSLSCRSIASAVRRSPSALASVGASGTLTVSLVLYIRLALADSFTLSNSNGGDGYVVLPPTSTGNQFDLFGADNGLVRTQHSTWRSLSRQRHYHSTGTI
jgi:hypothetical protein